ncbi:hypothetical protein D3C85_1511660 [compost metagenome]
MHIVFTHGAIVPAQRLQLLEVQYLQPQHRVLRLLVHSQQLIDFQMQDVCIAVLRVLDQEHHQERDDRGGGVDDQLPGVVETKNRPTQPPQRDKNQRRHKGLGTASPQGEFLRDFCEFHCRVPYRDAPEFQTATAC